MKDKIGVIYKEKQSDIHFYEKHLFVPLTISKDNQVKKIYVKVDSLSENLNIKPAEIKQLSASNHLEALIRGEIKSKNSTDTRENIINSEIAQQKQLEKLSTLLSIDPSIKEEVLSKLPDAITFINQNLNEWDKKLAEMPNQNKEGIPIEKHLVIKKNGNSPPFSIEYFGKDSNNTPIVYIRYQKDFARGTSHVSKLANPFTGKILVKKKITKEKTANIEMKGFRDTKGIPHVISAVHYVEYQKIKSDKDVKKQPEEKGGIEAKTLETKFGIYTEFMSHGTLEMLNKNIPLTKEQKVRGFVQLAKGLGEMHKRGIIHHDLKPANVLVTKESVQDAKGKTVERLNFVVADLGSAADKDSLEGYKDGTTHFMSPEKGYWLMYEDRIASGAEFDDDYLDNLKGNLSEKVDVFALGVMLQDILEAEEKPDAELKKLVENMTKFDRGDFDTSKRFTMEQTLNALLEYCQKHDIDVS